MIWPDQHPELNEVCLACEKAVPQVILRQPDPDPQHQLMAAEDEANTQQQALDTGPAKYQPLQTAAMDRYLDLAKINQALQGIESIVKQHCSQLLKKPSKKPLEIDIALIGAAGFHCSA